MNKVKETTKALARSNAARSWERDTDLPETFVDYDEAPREYFLNAVTTVLDVQTRVSDLYNQPYDQIQEQLRLLIEKVKERQEAELHQQCGLWSSHQCRAVDEDQRPAAAANSRRSR